MWGHRTRTAGPGNIGRESAESFLKKNLDRLKGAEITTCFDPPSDLCKHHKSSMPHEIRVTRLTCIAEGCIV